MAGASSNGDFGRQTSWIDVQGDLSKNVGFMQICQNPMT